MHDKNLLSRPTATLLASFGAGRATPGSGSAAALNGILAAKLVRTVCQKSVQKGSIDRPVDPKISYILEQVDAIDRRLQELFQKDSDDFQIVVDLRVQRDREPDRTKASALARRSLDALELLNPTVFAIADDCLRLTELAQAVFEDGWEHIRGDAGAALSSAISGAIACAFVLCLNAKTLRRRKGASDLLAKCSLLESRIKERQEVVMGCLASLRGEAFKAIAGSSIGEDAADSQHTLT